MNSTTKEEGPSPSPSDGDDSVNRSTPDPGGGSGTGVDDPMTAGDSVEETTQVVEGIMTRSVAETRRALQRFQQSMRSLTTAAAAAAVAQPTGKESEDKSSPSTTANTLSFENLTVLVPESGWKHCSCRDFPIRHYAADYLGVAVERNDAFLAMDGISGHVATGEMLLVLTSNEMAASTLMRALTGRLSSPTSSGSSSDQLSGSLLWNGIPVHASDLQPWRRLAPYVSARDDSHAAVLTVRETLQFAAECMAGGDTPKAAVTNRVQKLLEALGIDHVADTVVGDENLRGISGGQKRRVTVGEMLLNPDATFFGLENITDGLASTDSYNLIERLATATSVMETSAVISLLQPSDEIVELFDKLLVMTDDGKLAYFGSVDRQVLREIFLGPDADITQDSGSICDLVLGSFSDPSEISRIQERFQSTQAHEDMVRSLTQIRTQASQDRRLQKILPTGKYSCPWHTQMGILARRRIKLIARNAVTYTRIVIAILFSIIIGSLFSELNNDLIGSMSRTGYLFLNCFLVLMLSAAITIPSTFRDRVTLFKHRSAEFYSGRIAYIVQVLLDVPLSILEAVLLASISYYWVDMQSGANHFLNFVGVLIGLEFVGQAFGRFLCAVSRKQVSANSLSSVVILLFGTVAGFMPNYGAIPPVFRWLSWITPASYAFESIMINEFAERTISLAVVASPEGDVSVGQLAGESWLRIFSLPREEWGSLDAIKLFDMFFLFILAVVFDVFGCFYVEQTREWFFNRTRRPQRTAKSLDFEIQDKIPSMAKSNSEVGEDNESLKVMSGKHWPQSLSVEELCYFVPLKKKAGPKRFNLQAILGPCLVSLARKKKGDPSQSLHEGVSELQLLRNIKGRFRAGQMTALMGTSGAGKSTLLDVIAGYKTAGRASGTILIGGEPKETKVWKSISGYAEQQDVINPYMSTLETLRFTAACRLQSSDRVTAVNDVIRLMNLEEFQDVVVGKEVEAEGLPKHARKRLTIAIQLVTRPRILFCDEPTTGLSTQAANLVMNAIRRVTDELQLITVATIHQPSKLIWDSFDHLLLLGKGGQLAYMGDISRSMEYFGKLSGLQPPPQVNPADFVLSALENVSIDDAVSAFQKSDLGASLELEIENDKASMQPSNRQSIARALEKADRGKNVWKEIILLANRHLLTQWRNPSYSFMRLSASIGVSVYMGILFYSDKSVIQGAVLSIGAIFFFVFVLVIPMQATVVPLIEDRAVLYREATSGLYTRFSYGLGQVLADLPFHALNALLMFLCFYFLVDFRREADLIGYFILMIFLANWVVMSIGQLFAFASPNEESANGLSGLAVILSVILMGFLITVSAMPDYWEWAYWANLYHYIIQGLVTNELAGKTFLLELVPGDAETSDVNATNVFVPEPGTDLSRGSTAMQASAFLNLALLAGPGINRGIAESGFGALASLVQCMVANDCLFGDDASRGFLQCFIFPRAPCSDEFNTAVETVDVEEVLKCFAPTNSTDSNAGPTDVFDNERQSTTPSDLTEENVDAMTRSERLELVLCLMRALLPPSVTDMIELLLKIFNALFGVIFFVLDIIKNGINVPGELILFVFGWANFEDGEFDAPYKWYYCLTSVVIFLGSIELFKLFAVTFIVWTKR